MAATRSWGRRVFQLGALVLVAWGVYLSVRNSAEQLGKQQAELAERAERLRQQAQAAEASQDRRRLSEEAAQLEQAARRFWQASPTNLLLAGGLYAVGMLPASLFWRRCLMAVGQTGHLPDVLWAYFYGNLGKYFPGKAMVIVLRVGALQRHGVQKTATSMTIFMETLTMMSVGGAIAAVCLILLNLDWRLTLLAVGLLVSTFLPTAPPLLRFLLPKLQRGVDAGTMETWTQRITWRLLVRGWLALVLTWVAFGLSLLLVLRGLPSTDFGSASGFAMLLSSMGACALAVVLGFVSLLPGGAGVREVVLSTVLTPVVGPVAALCAAVWLRIVWLATELCVVGLLALTRVLRREAVPLPESPPT